MPSYQLGGHREYSYFSQFRFGTAPSLKLDTNDLEEIGCVFKKIESLDDKKSLTKRAIKWFSDLQKLPRASEYMVIGLFTIIESLLVHNPKGSYDSINHQISTKIPLLDDHLGWSLNYNKYFDKANDDKYWKKLYDYRCKLVHEGNIEIKGTLQILNNKVKVTEFLTDAVKKILKASLFEAEFINNLKKT